MAFMRKALLGAIIAFLAATIVVSGCVGGEDEVSFREKAYAKAGESLQCDFSVLTGTDENIDGKQVFVPANQAAAENPTEITISNLGACAVYKLKQ